MPFFIFFIIQKLIYGWFFFPEHISFIADSTTKMLNQLERYAAYLFIYQGRNILTFSVIIALIFVYFKGEKSSQKEKRASIVLLLQIFTGLLFCSLNFYSDRYVMFMVPLLILFFSYCIFKAFEFKWNSLAAIIIVGAVQYFHINQRSNCDHNLGYADAVKTHLQALDFLQHEKLQDKKIYASFLTLGYFQNPYEGYVSEGNRLRNMTGEFNDAAEYAIFSSREDEEFYNKLKQTGKLPTVFARFESHQAWSEIYKLKN